jgi:hypothetical protein
MGELEPGMHEKKEIRMWWGDAKVERERGWGGRERLHPLVLSEA